MRIYHGLAIEPDNTTRAIFATVTGQASTGEMIYTELEQTPDGAVTDQLILENQYIRTLKHGTQLFIRV